MSARCFDSFAAKLFFLGFFVLVKYDEKVLETVFLLQLRCFLHTGILAAWRF
jgi:hypothetical protein